MNNKQMKLYTEDQMKEAIRMARSSYNLFTTPFMYEQDEVLEKLTPIELPSDEEIEEVGHNHQRGGYEWQNEKRKSFIEGIKYLIDKIQGGNNEQQ